MSGEKVYLVVIAIVISGLFIFGTGYYYKHEQKNIKNRQHKGIRPGNCTFFN
jgi:hypothetical protein